MVITEEKENTSSSKSKRNMNLQATLNKEKGPDRNDNTPCCNTKLPSDNRNMNTAENNCVTNLAHLRLSGQNTSPRKMQKFTAKFSHLENLITPSSSPRLVKKALFLNKEDDNDVFHAPLTPTADIHSSTRSPSAIIQSSDREKQEVIAGRLYLVRQIGNASQSSGSPSSPSRAFTRPFSFSSIGLSSPTSSPPSPQSPNSKRQLPVYVRVYRCHKDHFALISRDSSYSSRHIYLNMKHCRVFPGDPIGRFIVAGNFDSGSMMEFETPDLGSLEKWLDALQTMTPPESPIRCANSCSGTGTGAGGLGKSSSSSNSTSSPSLPKSPGLPTLTEADEEERMS